VTQNTDSSDQDIYGISEASVEDRMRNFGELLDKIESADDKQKKLWREIYENAITDRHNAFMMFKQLAGIVAGKSSEHAIHGRSLASYLERMNKANDQLIKLAELVARAESSDGSIDPEKVYQQLGKHR
jgi:hypothetical protein